MTKSVVAVATSSGRLGDTTARDYSRKLQLFNAFAEPELRQAIHGLSMKPGMRILDAGCGTGEALRWFRDEIGEGSIVGIDLATAHTRAARAQAPADVLVAQADLTKLPFPAESFDLIWSVNTINHLHDPAECVRQLRQLLRPEGRIALGQSSMLADMYFAWDARLERLVTEAVRQYYRDRYHLDERDLAAVRGLLGIARQAGLRDVRATTTLIERTSPVGPKAQDYLLETIFRDTWGTRLRPYLSDSDYEELCRLCDPGHPSFALSRPDFHFLQSFTLVVGQT